MSSRVAAAREVARRAGDFMREADLELSYADVGRRVDRVLDSAAPGFRHGRAGAPNERECGCDGLVERVGLRCRPETRALFRETVVVELAAWNYDGSLLANALTFPDLYGDPGAYQSNPVEGYLGSFRSAANEVAAWELLPTVEEELRAAEQPPSAGAEDTAYARLAVYGQSAYVL